MPRNAQLLSVVLAAILGVLWEPFLKALFYLSGFIDIPVIRFLHSLHLSGDFARPVLAALWVALFGIFIGVPLGLLAGRHAYLTCITFVIAALLGSAVFAWSRGATISDFVAGWTVPESVLFAVAVPAFALLSSRFIYRRNRLAT